MSGEYKPPAWADALFPVAKAAVAKAMDLDGGATWKRAMLQASSFPDNAELIRYMRAWRLALETRSEMTRAAFTIWWWQNTRETRHPWPDEVKEAAESLGIAPIG